MDQPGPSRGNSQIAKRRKSNNQGADDAIAAVKVEQTGDIFKLDIDCYEEAFDYMPLDDLINAGKTCKRLQQVAGYCFQQNYSGAAVCNAKGIQSCNYQKYNLEHFARFIQRLRIEKGDGFQYFFNARSKFQRLKQIHIHSLRQPEMNRLKEVSMGKIEVLRINSCDLSSLHGLLDQCVKLKRLNISWHTVESSLPNRKYTTLEYLKLFPIWNGFIEGIPTFLELNPNIRKFVTTSRVLWNNRDEMMARDIKLDDLAILKCKRDDHDETKSIYDLLNKLYECGFYRKLILHLSIIRSQETLDQLANVKGLSGLHAIYVKDSLSFSVLKNLEELKIIKGEQNGDLASIKTLKCIQFGKANIDDIMPFIRESVEMQQIKVEFLLALDGNVIDLFTLNREREKLPDAHKITLYVAEYMYLATKWAMKETDFGLIRLKRDTSFECSNDFEV